MNEILTPRNADQVLEAVAWAVSEERPLEILGNGTKRDLGRPVSAATTLDLSALSGITLYEPEELVMTAGPGTALAEIEKTLADGNQELAFEPADLGPLLGGEAGKGSIGGVFGCNLAGPRRFKAGAARDHLLGFHAVSGRGETFKSGGRVVKNVTGYDLSKLMAGSYGTLAALTEVTFKVLPRGEKARTLLISGLSDDAAVKVMSEASQTAHEVSGLAHLPKEVAARSAVEYVSGAGASVTAIRVEGPGPSVEYRLGALKAQFEGKGEMEELHSHNSRAFWREVANVAPFVEQKDRVVWRLSVTPMEGAGVVSEILAEDRGEAFYDWAGGLIWMALDAGHDPRHELVRGAVAKAGGHASLVRAPLEMRANFPVFQPQVAGLAALGRRVKESFDPKLLLNPGRMYEGV